MPEHDSALKVCGRPPHGLNLSLLVWVRVRDGVVYPDPASHVAGALALKGADGGVQVLGVPRLNDKAFEVASRARGKDFDLKD